MAFSFTAARGDSSVEQLSHEIEVIRQQTAASLDDLRNVALQVTSASIWRGRLGS